MKTETYNALAAINRGFDMTLESLTILKQEGILTAEYVQQQTEIAEELRASLNHMILDKLEDRELDDRDHYAKMRSATEASLKAG
jgi:predicted nucleotidyltransferase